MLKKVLQIWAVSVLGCSGASGVEIVIDSTYYMDGRDDSKEVVYDKNTELTWQDDNSAKSVRKDWQEAIEYCQDLNFAGYDDWRVPSQEELRTIVDEKNHPTIKSEFKNTASDNYWSSTPVQAIATMPGLVSFNDGYEYYNSKGNNNNVRCVRDQ